MSRLRLSSSLFVFFALRLWSVCVMFMNKDMRSLWPFYTVSCTVIQKTARTTTTNGGRFVRNKRNVATWRDSAVFFPPPGIYDAPTYTRFCCHCVYVLAFAVNAVMLDRKKKKTVDWEQRTYVRTYVYYIHRRPVAMLNNAFTFLADILTVFFFSYLGFEKRVFTTRSCIIFLRGIINNIFSTFCQRV